MSENDGDIPIDLVDDNLPKSFFAMFCLDSLDLEKSDSKAEGLLATDARGRWSVLTYVFDFVWNKLTQALLERLGLCRGESL